MAVGKKAKIWLFTFFFIFGPSHFFWPFAFFGLSHFIGPLHEHWTHFGNSMYLPQKCNVDATWDGVLRVPYAQKDCAKKLGAVWDSVKRVWVVPPAIRARRHEFAAWDANRAPELPNIHPLLLMKRAGITRELARLV